MGSGRGRSSVAPITGTVALVNIAAGQQVTGSQGSGATANFVIEGPSGQEATTGAQAGRTEEREALQL